MNSFDSLASFSGTLAPHWWWLIAAGLLAILEIFAPGIFLIWIAIAAAVTGVILSMVDLSFPVQAVIFAVLAFASVFAGRLYYARNPVPNEDPNLNARAARLIGKTVTVEQAIENGAGRVRVGDGVWNARGPDLPAGSHAQIVAADGTCLHILPIDQAPAGTFIPPA
ncbi:MAG: NfeD family protein [Alphaproteobacteria bacterium]|nr:MAG: NfeD family protein [Alphaproteobacteria bacterium]